MQGDKEVHLYLDEVRLVKRQEMLMGILASIDLPTIADRILVAYAAAIIQSFDKWRCATAACLNTSQNRNHVT